MAEYNYQKTSWVNDSTPLNAANMNKIEDGIEAATEGLNTKQDTLTFDSVPTPGSDNPVTSGGIHTALSVKANSADVYTKTQSDNLLNDKADKSTTYTKTEVDNALALKVNANNVYTKTEVDGYLDTKQDTLTFDTTPTDNSENPVTSNGIYDALATKQNNIQAGDITNDMLAGDITGDKLAQTTKNLFDAAGAANNAVTTHNESDSAHEDIRNAVATKANSADVTSALALKADITYVDTELAKKQNTLEFDSVPTENSQKMVKSGGIYTALSEKQNNLTFDSTPTAGSTNPVTSGGIKNAIDTALSDYVPTSRTIAGLDLTQNRTAQEITDSLIYCNSTTDIDYIMGDN